MADPIPTPASDLISGGEAPAVDSAAPVVEAPAAPADGEVAPSSVKFDAFDVPETFLKAVTAKGWKSVGDVLESYTALEQLAGLEKGDALAQGRILTRPKPDAKAEEIADFFGKAGAPFVPKTAEEYGIKPPEGVDPAPFEEAAGLFHKAEIPKPYADKLLAAVAESETAKVNEFKARSGAEVAELQGEWGAAFEQNTELARRAATAAGLDGDALQRIELAIGTKTMLKAFAEFGKQYREMESPAPGAGAGANQFRTTPEQAAAKITSLQADAEFMARYLSPNPGVRGQAVKEMEELHKLAYPNA